MSPNLRDLIQCSRRSDDTSTMVESQCFLGAPRYAELTVCKVHSRKGHWDGSSPMPCGTPWAGSAGPLAQEGRIPEVGGLVRAGAVLGLGIGPRY